MTQKMSKQGKMTVRYEIASDDGCLTVTGEFAKVDSLLGLKTLQKKLECFLGQSDEIILQGFNQILDSSEDFEEEP